MILVGVSYLRCIKAAVEVALRLQPFHDRSRLLEAVIAQIDHQGERGALHSPALEERGSVPPDQVRNRVDYPGRVRFDLHRRPIDVRTCTLQCQSQTDKIIIIFNQNLVPQNNYIKHLWCDALKVEPLPSPIRRVVWPLVFVRQTAWQTDRQRDGVTDRQTGILFI